MKYLGLVMLVFCVSVLTYSQGKNLKLHYNFKAEKDGVIKDITGNGYDGLLKNGAYTDQMGDLSIVNLGTAKGYIDLGNKVGELISSLETFTVSTYVCVNESANLNANGNFIWSFSNSDDIIKDHNGCFFFSAKTQGYSITKTDYRTESGFSKEANLEKGNWKNVLYTQSGNEGKIYIDGELLTSGSVDLLPQTLGKTSFNFLGRSPYAGDTYLKGLIADFRIYNKALSESQVGKLSTGLKELNMAYEDYKKKPVKYVANQNPLFTHRFTADAAALVDKGTFYIYSGEDVGDGKWYNMPNWLVFSSTDMENWLEYPIPLKMEDFSWAKDNASWASQVIERNGKYYWYVSTEHATVHGKSIGVAVSDSPTGPFVDARGSALITNDMTTEYTGISWDDIDPTVWIDDDGQAYLFWGNTQCYYAKLKDNMIELDSEIKAVSLPAFTEAPWIHKKGEWYYLSYASGFPEKICYAMSKDINGPWEYKGILNEVAGNSNTNHQAIVDYKGKSYFVYHNGAIQNNGGSYLRSVCIDYLYYNNDGSMKRIQMTTEGVDKIE